jgi:predicted lactoylglutathione lyase
VDQGSNLPLTLITDLEKSDFYKLKIGNNTKALGDDRTNIGHSTILQKRNLLILLWATHFFRRFGHKNV